MCVCPNVRGLMEELRIHYVAQKLILFTDSSKAGLLLHNGNGKQRIKYPNLVTMKESYGYNVTSTRSHYYGNMSRAIRGALFYYYVMSKYLEFYLYCNVERHCPLPFMFVG